jgi:TfoX/Sxy family transcriptional regulator of competence genes
MKPIWKRVPPELIEFLAKALAPFPCERKSMFGCPVWFVNGNMFAGLHQDNLFIRLPAADQALLFKTYDEATLFEPMAGRPMKEYAVIPESLYGDGVDFRKWLDRSYGYAASLPRKEPKKASTRKKTHRS